MALTVNFLPNMWPLHLYQQNLNFVSDSNYIKLNLHLPVSFTDKRFLMDRMQIGGTRRKAFQNGDHSAGMTLTSAISLILASTMDRVLRLELPSCSY